MAMKESYYTVDGQMLGYKGASGRKDFLRDNLGSVTAEIDQTGSNRTFDGRYRPYGNLLWSTGTSGKFGWIGSWGYRSTGLKASTQYVRARHYSYSSGMWTTIDPLWPNWNAYCYTSSRPTKMVDPSGNKPQHHRPPRKLPPEPVVIPPSGYPGVPDPTQFSYGSYCGSANVKNPGWNIIPQDCVDSCCFTHDRCLEAHYGAGNTESAAHKCCDHELANCAKNAIYSGCCTKSPLPGQCIKAASLIWQTFTELCKHVYNCNDPAPPGKPRPGCLPRSKWKYHYERWWWDPDRSQPKKDPFMNCVPYEERPPTDFDIDRGVPVGHRGSPPP